jgi:thiamine biosynthesis lipoprotein
MSAKRKTSRREFLKGKSAVDALADLTHGSDGLDAAPSGADVPDVQRDEQAGAAAADVTPSPFLMRVGRKAMACQFEVLLNARTSPEAAEGAIDALDLVDQLEDQMTVYRDDSEVMGINRHAAERDVEVETHLFDLLTCAAQLHQATGGAFDITSGPLTKAWGFYRRKGRMPTDEELAETLARVGGHHLIFDDQRRTIRFAAEGVEINLGAIGKGYALDRACQLLVDAGATDFLLHGGQSSVLARGNRLPAYPGGVKKTGGPSHSSSGIDTREKDDADAAPSGWLIGVTHPLRPRERLALVRLKDAAMGTSGSGTQFFTHHGKRYGHILDPRTGRPADGVLSVSVIAPSAATADALATAFYVMGVEPALEFCDKRPELSAIITAPGKQRGAIQILTAGLNDEDWQRIDGA